MLIFRCTSRLEEVLKVQPVDVRLVGVLGRNKTLVEGSHQLASSCLSLEPKHSGSRTLNPAPFSPRREAYPLYQP